MSDRPSSSDGKPSVSVNDAEMLDVAAPTPPPSSEPVLKKPIIVTPNANVIKKIADAHARRDASHGVVDGDWTEFVIPETGEKVSTRERIVKGAFGLGKGRDCW